MHDWRLVGGDPAPGEPGEIRSHATRVQQVADDAGEALEAMVDLAHGVGDSGWTGDASVAFLAKFADLPPELRRLCEAYASVGSTLHRYADRLEDLQHEAVDALNRAVAADQARRQSASAEEAGRNALAAHTQAYRQASGRADTAFEHYQDAATTGNPSATALWYEHDRLRRDANLHSGRIAGANAEVIEAVRLIGQADRALGQAEQVVASVRDDFAAAVSTAVREVEQALPESWRNPSTLEAVFGGITGGVLWALEQQRAVLNTLLDLAEAAGQGWDAFAAAALDIIANVREILSSLADLAGSVATILTVASIVFPGLAPLAAAITIVAGVLAIATLLTTLVLFSSDHRNASGERSVTGGDLFWDTVKAGAGAAGVRKGVHALRPGAVSQLPTGPYAPLEVAWGRYGGLSDIGNGLKSTAHQFGAPVTTVISPLTNQSLTRVETALTLFEGVDHLKSNWEDAGTVRGWVEGPVRTFVADSFPAAVAPVIVAPSPSIITELITAGNAHGGGLGTPIVAPLPQFAPAGGW